MHELQGFEISQTSNGQLWCKKCQPSKNPGLVFAIYYYLDLRPPFNCGRLLCIYVNVYPFVCESVLVYTLYIILYMSLSA